MVRTSRFAFDNPRGAGRMPMIRPFEEFDDPGGDEPDVIDIEPHRSVIEDEPDEALHTRPKKQSPAPAHEPRRQAS